MQIEGGIYMDLMFNEASRKRKIWKTVLLVLVFSAINYLGRGIARNCNLPVWLDTIGTYLAAYFIGMGGSLGTAVLGSMLNGIKDVTTMLYLFTSIGVAVIWGFVAQKKRMKDYGYVLIVGFVIGIIAVILSVPVNLVVRGGKSGNIWGDAVFDMLSWYNVSKMLAALADEAIVNIFDKQITAVIGCAVISVVTWISDRIKIKEVKNTVAQILVIAVISASVPFMSGNVVEADAETIEDEYADVMGHYMAFVYDSNNGMPSSEANVVEETDDGYIWIGNYAGLTRFDGVKFEFITDGGISNVTAMAKDADGVLWIGTNDKGIVRYDNGEFKFYSTDDGLTGNSVRSIAIDDNGIIYIGTMNELCMMDKDGNIVKVEGDIVYARSLEVYDGCVIGVDNDGELFAIENGKKVCGIYSEDNETVFTSVGADKQGLVVGNTSNYIERVSYKNGKFTIGDKISIGSLANVTSVRVDSKNRAWVCAENGLGYMLDDNSMQVLNYDNFDRSVQWMHEDYEGNLWFASSRYGVLKLSENNFVDVFTMAGVDDDVVNAVAIYNDEYYCATDGGLDIIDKTQRKEVENEITGYLEGERIRALLKDSKNNLWVFSYGNKGLVKYSADGNVTNFTMENSGVTNNRFRCGVELGDGTIVAGTSDGINYIKNDKVTSTLTAADGMTITQILCLLVGDNGEIYAGSDGAGIYVIEDGKIKDTITTKNGLSSDVILRIVSDGEDGYFVITSNSLCHMKDGKVRQLTNFPYFNNFDIVNVGTDTYVISSNGLYVADTQSLKNNREDTVYSHFGNTEGLSESITANSWNIVENDEYLYLCCNNSLIKYMINSEKNIEHEYKYGVESVIADGKEIKEKNGVYLIDSSVKKIGIKASIRNYSLNKIKVKYYIDGLEDNPPIVSQDNIVPIQLTNLKYGRYKVHLQLISEDEEEILDEKNYVVEKDAQMWEKDWFRLYLIIVLVWFVIFATWLVMNWVNTIRKRKDLEKYNIRLEKQVAEQTEAIKQQAEKMEKFQWSVVESMASLIESRDGNTGEHVINTRFYVSIIANKMYEEKRHPDIIDKKFVQNLVRSAPMHDVGKIKISDTILNKPGKFEDWEFEIMKKHSEYGGEIIGNILGKDADGELIEMARDVALYHHEKWNGKGYPTGKSGEDIPISARIMAVADVFDALVSKRVYKDSMPLEKAFEIIEKDSGVHFDPEVAEVFLSLRSVVEKRLESRMKNKNK